MCKGGQVVAACATDRLRCAISVLRNQCAPIFGSYTAGLHIGIKQPFWALLSAAGEQPIAAPAVEDSGGRL